MPVLSLDSLQRLHAIAQIGLAYSTNPYDLERFREIAGIAEQGLAALLEEDIEAIRSHYDLDKGYPTPKVDVRTAVFSAERLLLVRESADGLWTMPGGWADETDSPRQAAEREVLEESGYRVRVTRLVSVKDRRAHGYVPKILGGCYKLFFLAEMLDGAAKTSLETTAVEFFSLDRLPPLSLGRTLPEDIEQAYAAHCDPTRETVID
jgi:ADP-ribose pyrophosphatase YjhB (NUDIX family)